MTALLFTAFTAYTVHVTFRNTYEPMHDSFGGNVGGLPSQFGEVVIFGPCLLLAILIHPTLNSDFVSDVSWTFSMYLESLAVLPQLYLFQKGKQVRKDKNGYSTLNPLTTFLKPFGRRFAPPPLAEHYHAHRPLRRSPRSRPRLRRSLLDAFLHRANHL